MAATYSSRPMLMAGAGSPMWAMSSGSLVGGGSGMLTARAMRTIEGQAVDEDHQGPLLDVLEDLAASSVGDAETTSAAASSSDPTVATHEWSVCGLGEVGEDREGGVGLLEVEHPVGLRCARSRGCRGRRCAAGSAAGPVALGGAPAIGRSRLMPFSRPL